MKHLTKYCLGLIAAACMTTACSHGDFYSDFKALPTQGWQADSIVSFSFDVTDTTAHYDVLWCVRNLTSYPYQNLWFFVHTQQPNGQTQADTIEFYLADQRGQWLGNGIGSLKEMPVLYQQNVQFPQIGTYTYTVQHGMREKTLRGLSDVGIRVTKHESNHGEK